MSPARFNTPTALIETRMSALEQGDFELIYDSYSNDAPFLKHFSEKTDYLAFAGQQLVEVALTDWKILKQRQTSNGQLEVLLWMQMAGSPVQNFYELALLISTDKGWRYHSAQKLTDEDYSGAVDEISFCHFDQAVQKIRF